MNAIASFLSKLQKQEIELWLEGESLRFKAPQGAMTSELKGEIRAYRTHLRSN